MSLALHYSNPGDLTSLDVDTISAAKTSIHMAAYSLTESHVIAALCEASERGVQVAIYLDRSEVEAEARGNPNMPTSPLSLLLNRPNITTRVKASLILMHLKSYAIDTLTLRDGSANISPQGETEQDNSLILTDEPALVTAFLDKFAAMWNRPDNLTVAQAVTEANRRPSAPHQR
jgi:phosphatidylserine/phosphatidylglycerophosphate/cardiolipin synthase-like enzyme